MTKHLDVSLVIKNQDDMTQLLEYLIVRMETVDGIKGSALPYLQAIKQQSNENDDSMDYFSPSPFALGNDLNQQK